MTKNNYKITADDRRLFTTTVGDVKILKQDIVFYPTRKEATKITAENNKQPHYKQREYHLSDEYQPLLKYSPTRYCKNNIPSYEIKKLSTGMYTPDLCLDLHGLTQKEAKEEIKALVDFCLRKKIYCVCIVSGHGKSILKKQTPMWLAQHPNVLGFHQAPRKYGGSAALLCLIDFKEH